MRKCSNVSVEGVVLSSYAASGMPRKCAGEDTCRMANAHSSDRITRIARIWRVDLVEAQLIAEQLDEYVAAVAAIVEARRRAERDGTFVQGRLSGGEAGSCDRCGDLDRSMTPTIVKAELSTSDSPLPASPDLAILRTVEGPKLKPQ